MLERQPNRHTVHIIWKIQKQMKCHENTSWTCMGHAWLEHTSMYTDREMEGMNTISVSMIERWSVDLHWPTQLRALDTLQPWLFIAHFSENNKEFVFIEIHDWPVIASNIVPCCVTSVIHVLIQISIISLVKSIEKTNFQRFYRTPPAIHCSY